MSPALNALLAARANILTIIDREPPVEDSRIKAACESALPHTNGAIGALYRDSLPNQLYREHIARTLVADSRDNNKRLQELESWMAGDLPKNGRAQRTALLIIRDDLDSVESDDAFVIEQITNAKKHICSALGLSIVDLG